MNNETNKNALLRITEAIADGKTVCVELDNGDWQRIIAVGLRDDHLLGYADGCPDLIEIELNRRRVSIIEFVQKAVLYDCANNLSREERKRLTQIGKSCIPERIVEELLPIMDKEPIKKFSPRFK